MATIAGSCAQADSIADPSGAAGINLFEWIRRPTAWKQQETTAE
jgi:hypothetical protein